MSAVLARGSAQSPPHLSARPGKVHAMARRALALLALVAAVDVAVLAARVSHRSQGLSPDEPAAGVTSRDAKSTAAAALEELPEFRKARWVRVDRGVALSQVRLSVLRSAGMGGQRLAWWPPAGCTSRAFTQMLWLCGPLPVLVHWSASSPPWRYCTGRT